MVAKSIQDDIIIQLSERVAVLETNANAVQATLTSVEGKLDDLLELKAKGMGAMGLASLIIGSGLIGLIGIIVTFFKNGNAPHL